jgi:hypothetical protein
LKEKNYFGVFLNTFWETLKTNTAKTAQKQEKRGLYRSVLEINVAYIWSEDDQFCQKLAKSHLLLGAII